MSSAPLMKNITAVFVAACILSATSTGCHAQEKAGPKEEDVRAALGKSFYDRNADATEIKFDTAVLVAAPARGDVTPVLGKTVYPVKVNFTEADSYPTRTILTHWKDGIYNFYLDEFGAWKFYTASQATFKNESVPK